MHPLILYLAIWVYAVDTVAIVVVSGMYQNETIKLNQTVVADERVMEMEVSWEVEVNPWIRLMHVFVSFALAVRELEDHHRALRGTINFFTTVVVGIVFFFGAIGLWMPGHDACLSMVNIAIPKVVGGTMASLVKPMAILETLNLAHTQILVYGSCLPFLASICVKRHRSRRRNAEEVIDDDGVRWQFRFVLPAPTKRTGG